VDKHTWIITRTQLMVLDQRGSKTRLILLSECWWSKVAETYECVKYLGVSIDKDLSLTTQNEHAQCRAKLALMCTLLTVRQLSVCGLEAGVLVRQLSV